MNTNLDSMHRLTPADLADAERAIEDFAEDERLSTEESDQRHSTPRRAAPPKRAKQALTLVSGGAPGADLAWAQAGVLHGLAVDIMSFPGHRASAPPGTAVRHTPVTAATAGAADAALSQAAKGLMRPAPSTRTLYVHGLLRRNYAIVADADALFAVGRLSRGAKSGPPTTSVNVDGGTGWACQLFADRIPATPTKLDMFLYDQGEKAWFKCSMGSERQLRWTAVATAATAATPAIIPRRRHWRRIAVIGTRQLTSCGRQAIAGLVASWQQ